MQTKTILLSIYARVVIKGAYYMEQFMKDVFKAYSDSLSEEEFRQRAPQNQFNVKSSWEKRTELKSLHTDVISS